MKPRWLLLAASLVCLLVLAPASMLSGQGIWVGCGTADVNDGVMGADEWAPAAVIPGPALWPYAFDPSVGTFLVMNDLDAVYVGGTMDVAGIVTNPTLWQVHGFYMCFEDEDVRDDGAFASNMCPTSEGCYHLDATSIGPFFTAFSGIWHSFRETPGGGFPCPPQPLGPGVRGGVIPGDDFSIEAMMEFNVSELDAVEPGDCLPMGFTLQATAATLAPPASRRGVQEWPAALWMAWAVGDWPDAYGVICLSDCEPDEEFVAEPGTVMLLASGLMGMAGYAGLRLRKK